MGDRIAPAHRARALQGIRAFHTAVFASVAAALALVTWDGLRARPGRRTLIAGALVAVETVVYLSNDEVCPLTPLAETLGSANGVVADLFLPAWAARRIPLVAGSTAVAALLLNLRAMAAARARGAR